MSLGYVNMFKEDDEDLFVDKQCNESVTSYDPNDKTGTPKGYGINSICLLYTSPSPRDRTRSRMPSSACKKKEH